MFNKQNKETQASNNKQESVGSSINLIGAGTVIEGDIRSNGDLRIDGAVYGHVFSKAKVVLGTTGLIEGDVNCQNADVSGSITGHTNVLEMLFLKSHARINGDIHTGKVVVEVGASFTGNCNMGAPIKDIKHVDKPTESRSLQEKTA